MRPGLLGVLQGVCVSQALTIAFVPLLDCSLCAHVVTTWAFHQQTVMMLLVVDPQVCLRPRISRRNGRRHASSVFSSLCVFYVSFL